MTDFAVKASELDPCLIAFKKQFPEMHKGSYAWTLWREGWDAGQMHYMKENQPEGIPIPFFGWLK